MPLQLGPVPNLQTNIPQVNPVEQLTRLATLRNLTSENTTRAALAPLQIQEATERAKQAGIQTQVSQQDLDSRKAMMSLIANGELNKYAGVETPDGSGFDAPGAFQYMLSKGVQAPMASEYVNSWLTIGKSQSEISKNLGEAGKAQQEIREKTLKQVANKLADIGDMPVGKAATALDSFRQDLVRNVKAYPGLTQQEMAELYGADLTHLDALEGHFGIADQVANFHKSKAEATTAQTAATRGVIELAALPQQLQDAHVKNVAETRRAAVETTLQTKQLDQLRQNEQYIRQPDASGFTTPLPVTEYNKRYDSFTASPGYKQIQTLQGSYQQFGTILNDLDAGRSLTGAASVVALFNAIGISAEPLAGKGFRINSNTIQEHIGARGLDQSAYQKILSLKQGDVITPKQVRDYADIAANVYKNAYVNTSDEAHRQGLPADFLPRGGGKMIDSTTAKIYANVVAHQNPALARDPAKLQQAAMAAARKNGWGVDTNQ